MNENPKCISKIQYVEDHEHKLVSTGIVGTHQYHQQKCGVHVEFVDYVRQLQFSISILYPRRIFRGRCHKLEQKRTHYIGSDISSGTECALSYRFKGYNFANIVTDSLFLSITLSNEILISSNDK